jgi:hypothetical protein
VDAPSYCVAGPMQALLPFVRESCSLSPCRKIRKAGIGEPARGLSWLARLSGGAASLGRTSRVIRYGSDPERQVGGPPRVPGGRAPGPVGLGTKTAFHTGQWAVLSMAQ